MTETLDLVVSPYVSAAPAGDSVWRLAGLLDDYTQKRLQGPMHQRDADAWGIDKRREYVARLRRSAEGCHPPGLFATYQVVDVRRGVHPGPTFLNDGLQRLTTLLDLMNNPSAYGMDDDGVGQLLQQNTSVQHRHYVSHEEAMRDFQLINNGTQLTPLELCRGILRYAPRYESHWERLLGDVDDIISASESRLCRRTSKKNNREHEHKRKRHALALLHRYLTKDSSLRHYPDVQAKGIQRSIDRREPVVETLLVEHLEEIGPDEARRQVDVFRRFIESETATLESCMREVLDSGEGLQPLTQRWLLDLSVWRKWRKVPVDEYRRFVIRQLEATKGASQWRHHESDGRERAVTLSYTHLGLLPTLARFAGMPESFCERPGRRNGKKFKPGYDNSHVTPFSTNGDGPTFPEPASINRARGAEPVLDQDLFKGV